MLKLSFILPCYNVAPYIGRCIESIEHQDIPQSEYEIICVDDCSTDDTVRKIKEYQAKYPNIQLICHTENKTAGGARNTGINHACGEYIWFVDPDDKIMPNSLQKLWNEVQESKVDILFFNNNVHTYTGECVDVNLFAKSEILSGQYYLQKYFPNNITKISSVWREIMRRDYIINSGIRYPEIPASQDVVFLWEVICNARKVQSIDSIHYSVFKRDNSTTGTRGRCTARTCFSFSILYPIALSNMIKRNDLNNIIKYDLSKAIYRTINDNSRILFLLTYSEKRKFYSLMLKYKENVYSLGEYMNSMTKRLFKHYHCFLIWSSVVSILLVYYRLKIIKKR